MGIAIIGTGMVADIHVRALRENADLVRIAGVYSRDRAKREAFCAERDLAAVDSLEALIGSPDVDIVLVLTPANARRDIVEKCAAAGKHVLLEKPIERNTDAARQIVEIAENAGITLGVVFQHRFRAASQALQSMIAQDRFGKLASAQILVPWWRPQSYYDAPGRGTYAREGGGVMINQAIHTLDLALTLTGPVTEVRALAATTALHKMEAEDFVSAGFRFASGAVGAFVATTASYPGSPESITLDFENAAAHLQSGVLTVHWHDGKTEEVGEPATTGGGADPMAFPHDWHASAQRDFLAALAEHRAPTVTGREALHVHALIDAIALSSREGKAVTL